MKIKNILCVTAAALIGLCCLSGCQDKESVDGGDTGSSAAETPPLVNDIELFCEDTALGDKYADLMTRYFKAIQEGDFGGYQDTLQPLYAEKMEAYLQENFQYGLEQSFGKRREQFEITESNHYRFTAIKLEEATDTDIADYMKQMAETLGEGFDTDVQAQMTGHTIIVFSLLAVSDDLDSEATVVDEREMVVAETADGSLSLFG